MKEEYTAIIGATLAVLTDSMTTIFRLPAPWPLFIGTIAGLFYLYICSKNKPPKKTATVRTHKAT